MHAVVDSTEDLLLFILSEKGQRVRVFLLRDIVEAADVFLQDEVIDCALNGNRQDQRILRFEVLSLVKKNSCVCVQGNTKFLMAPCHVHRLCIKWQCGEKCTNLSV
jgi:hypothetical protein